MSSIPAVKTCPRCERELVENQGHRTWCAECDWNLTDDLGRPRRGFVRRRLDGASDRLVVSLYEDLRAHPVSRPGWDAARVTSYAIAAGVHLMMIGLVVAAIVVSALHPILPFFLLSLLLLLIAFFIRPRLGRIPKSSLPLAREDAPGLYRLADQIADEVGARRADVIAIDGFFNAAYMAVGLRRRRVATIGLPLWSALTPEERVSVLAHEMAHGVNGDSRHLLMVGTALHTLERLTILLRPDPHWEARTGGIVAPMLLALRLAKWLLRLPVAAAYLALALLTLRASQRAEYLADRLAARAASPAAAAGALDRLQTVHETLLPAISFQAAFPQKIVLWHKYRELIAELPALELERRRRVAALVQHRVDSTHPPTNLRIALLRELPATEPKVLLTPEQAEAIETELRPHYVTIAARLTAPYRAAHYES